MPVGVGEHVEGTLKMIWQVSDKVTSGELSLSISAKYYIKLWKKLKNRHIITLRSKFCSHEGYGTIKYIYNVHYIVKRICFQYEAAFVFWIKGLTFIILNISGVIITDNLRAILLFEADLNFSNKLYLWIRLMKRAQRSGVISQKQNGVISGHT